MITYSNFRELVGVGVERYQHLVAELVREVLPEHLHVLRLHVQQVVARPPALVHLRDRFHKRFGRSLHRWKKEVKQLTSNIFYKLAVTKRWRYVYLDYGAYFTR